MSDRSIGIILAHVFMVLVLLAVHVAARWRRKETPRFLPIGLYLIMMPPCLVLFGGVGGDRQTAAVTLAIQLVGAGFLVVPRLRAAPEREDS